MAEEATEATPFRARRWYRRRDLWFVAVVAAFIAVYYAWGYATGPGRITAALHAALDADPKRVNIVVTPKFPPEQFHMAVFQEYGAMRGTEGRAATLYRVKPADVRRLSRRYWIEKIDLAPGK
jgi:hypothetical protein